MKQLSKTKTALFATIGIIGASSVAFAANNFNLIPTKISPESAKVSLTQAIDIAKQKAQGDVVSAEFKGKPSLKSTGGMYKVEIADAQGNQKVKINAMTGEVISIKQEKADKDDVAEYSALRQAKLNLTQAMQTVSQTVGGQIVEAEFDVKNGLSLYKFETLKDNQVYKVKIDANTGAVLSNQADSHDDDDDK